MVSDYLTVLYGLLFHSAAVMLMMSPFWLMLERFLFLILLSVGLDSTLCFTMGL